MYGDPIEDFERYDADRERKLRCLPVCSLCREHIQQETAVCFNDEWICDECLDDLRKETLEDGV